MTRIIVARWIASALAVLAFVDPEFRSSRPTKPEIAVVAGSRADAPLAQRVGDRLRSNFTVVPRQWDRAAATVIVGTSVPVTWPGGRVYAVNPETPIDTRAWNTVRMLVTATGGSTGTIDQVVPRIVTEMAGVEAREWWWPMRSSWWLLPLALLVGLEWVAARRARDQPFPNPTRSQELTPPPPRPHSQPHVHTRRSQSHR